MDNSIKLFNNDGESTNGTLFDPDCLNCGHLAPKGHCHSFMVIYSITFHGSYGVLHGRCDNCNTPMNIEFNMMEPEYTELPPTK